jgi:alanine-glyoxylate transaminase/serine-glyoxylate transaminase/serine-pyruvate transaminase
MKAPPGRHFLQIPGPTNVPDRVLRAMDRPTIDHRGPEFQRLARRVLEGIQGVFKTRSPVIIYPASGTGAWEAALVNTLSPGDRVLVVETGQFASSWQRVATQLGLVPVVIPTDWRRGADPALVEARLVEDVRHEIRAVMIVHNETSTGVASPVAAVRSAIDRAKHPALFLVDTVSSLACMEYRHDEWGVDVTVAGSQKGLMLPPGLSFNAVSDKALAGSRKASLPRSYFRWDDQLPANREGRFPYTPATNLLYGLEAALELLSEEGLDNVFRRHARLGEATRRAVQAWGLELLCQEPAHYSSSVTAVCMPAGESEVALRRLILERYNLSLGAGLGRLQDKVFRIGHLGDFNELMLLGTLAGIEMGLHAARVPHRSGGVDAAMAFLRSPEEPKGPQQESARAP